MSDKENMTSDRIRQQMMVRNPIMERDICKVCGHYKPEHDINIDGEDQFCFHKDCQCDNFA